MIRHALSAATILMLGVLRPESAWAQATAVPSLCGDREPVTDVNTSVQRPSRAGAAKARPASDLFCIDLFSTAAGGDATGVIELERSASPFGVSVDADGYHANDLTAWIEDLPDPRSLGPYTTYVAWATPLVLDPVVKLGEVGNGVNRLGRVAFNKFLIMISAESSGDVVEREGRLVLRGRSPSSKMEAHDMLAQAPSAEQGTGATHQHETNGWGTVPGYAGIPMLPGIMSLRPRVTPLWLDSLVDADLPSVEPRQVVVLPNGGTLDLTAEVVTREIRGQPLLMLAFNRQQPGPLIKVDQESTIFVNFANQTPFPTSVHWHGLRLDNRFDGVPGVTQDPVAPGETFQYQIYFPDAGIYWYHPHHREDIQQELGLYGNMLVEPAGEDYYAPANREEILMLDDLLLGDAGPIPFGTESADFMLMGRFGNTLLVNGEPDYELRVDRGEVVRFFFTNVANTRTFNLSVRAVGAVGAAGTAGRVGGDVIPMKVVASDVGKFEREEMVESVVIAPAERYVVDVMFGEPGIHLLTNHVQGINHRQGVFLPEVTVMGRLTVSSEDVAEDHGRAFEALRENADVVADIDRYRDRFDDPADHELLLSLEVADLPLPIEQSMLYDWVYFNPVEWTGTMPMMNWATSAPEVRWILRDPATGSENMDIDWRFRVGDVVKIRVYNDRDAFHAMQHPLHFHGQRFLVLEQNGTPNRSLVWKDTVLLPSGSTTDILLELSNPGRWMVHCHIAEHLESGMKFVMNVEGN